MTRLIPMVCPYCGWKCKLTRAHEDHCPSHGEGHAVPTEMVPGLWVGGVAARADERFVAAASILTRGEHHWAAGAKIDPPPGKWLFVEHEDRKPGLIAKAPEIWAFIDEHMGRGPVLVHCGAGASRSVTVVAGWLMTRRGMSAADAVAFMLSKRPQVMYLWEGFEAELLALA
jgi:hypothetical protein